MLALRSCKGTASYLSRGTLGSAALWCAHGLPPFLIISLEIPDGVIAWPGCSCEPRAFGRDQECFSLVHAWAHVMVHLGRVLQSLQRLSVMCAWPGRSVMLHLFEAMPALQHGMRKALTHHVFRWVLSRCVRKARRVAAPLAMVHRFLRSIPAK